MSSKTCNSVTFTHDLIKIFIQCVRISCVAARSLYAISHATERSSIFSKSKLILSPVSHINFLLKKTSKNVEINIKYKETPHSPQK